MKHTPITWTNEACELWGADYALHIATQCLRWAPGDKFWQTVAVLALLKGGEINEQ